MLFWDRRYREVKPDIVHHVGLQASMIGSIAAMGLPVRRLNMLAGLGFVFTSRSLKARLLRALLSRLLARLFGGHDGGALVQNPDDFAIVASLGVMRERIHLIPGSGVDPAHFSALPEPDGPPTMAYAGRMLADKGLRTLIAAQALLAAWGRPVRLLLAGMPDPANPTSIPERELAEWARRPGVSVLGQVADIRQLWSAAHIAVLASRREGLPKSLLEAAACGRPIVASDVPGCREIARNGVNALLAPPDDAAALARAIDRLATDAEMRRRFGAAGRDLVEREFSSERVGEDIVRLYRGLLRTQADRPSGQQ